MVSPTLVSIPAVRVRYIRKYLFLEAVSMVSIPAVRVRYILRAESGKTITQVLVSIPAVRVRYIF